VRDGLRSGRVNDLLVTGSRGFVGRHLLARAADRGIVAVGPSGDLRDPAVADAAVRDAAPRAVVHLAGTAHAARRADPWAALADDLLLAGNLLAAVARHAPDAPVLVAGSAAQYGRGRYRLLREDDATVPISAYGSAKDLVERAVLGPGTALGVRTIAVRAFNHCGPGQALDAPAAQWAQQLAHARRAGGGTLRTGDLTVRRDFLDVRDVADAYLALAFDAPDAAGVVNVCSGTPTALERVVALLVEAAGVPVTVERDPALTRTDDPPLVVGDPRRLHALTGWRPRIPLSQSLAEQLAEHLTSLETTTA
jgi:GDP-4-dehydro-6-deoxy-D-mannose reductase